MEELKEQLLRIIEKGYPDFNRDTSSFSIRWMSNPGVFIGFTSLHCYNDKGDIDGEFNPTNNEDILFEIINESGEKYIHSNKVIFGEIGYQTIFEDGGIEVTTSNHNADYDISEYSF